MAAWWLNYSMDEWWPLVEESAAIEHAFQDGERMISIVDTQGHDCHYMFQSMVQINQSDSTKTFKKIIRSWQVNDLPASYLPWLYQSEPLLPKSIEYSQMDPDWSTFLSVARKHGYNKIVIHRPREASTEFDLCAMTQLNMTTTTSRKIIPAPCDPPTQYILDANIPVPDEFICPISFELMVDPVIAEDGYTYERHHYERWVAGGKLKSPMTNIPFVHILAISNRALKATIVRFVDEATSKSRM